MSEIISSLCRFLGYGSNDEFSWPLSLLDVPYRMIITQECLELQGQSSLAEEVTLEGLQGILQAAL